MASEGTSDRREELEALLLKKVAAEEMSEVEQLLNSPGLRVDCVDENGMTALEHACYKGNYRMARLLIERGADVNSKRHIHGYSALMFAGLGGHLSVVNLLLESGASVTAVNSVGRSAAQMAAFVGQHSVVTLINNFVPKEEIDYFVRPHGLEKTGKLPLNLADPLHVFVRQTNIHPVKLVMHLSKNPNLVKAGKKVASVLELLCEKEMKKSDPNETLALKFHFLAFVVNHTIKHLSHGKQNKGEEASLEKSLELLVKCWLKGRDEDGFPVALEQLLRQSVREFPHRDCSLFIQLVRTLSAVAIGSEPSALTILLQTVNGQKGFNEDVPVCATCGEPNPSKKCSQCKVTQYCDQVCQKLHWFSHKKLCVVIKKQSEATLEKKEELVGDTLAEPINRTAQSNLTQVK